jgi:hypothetical protein
MCAVKAVFQNPNSRAQCRLAYKFLWIWENPHDSNRRLPAEWLTLNSINAWRRLNGWDITFEQFRAPRCTSRWDMPRLLLKKKRSQRAPQGQLPLRMSVVPLINLLISDCSPPPIVSGQHFPSSQTNFLSSTLKRKAPREISWKPGSWRWDRFGLTNGL